MSLRSVSRYMTRHPYAVERRTSVAIARELMTRYEIRHLPVIENGCLVEVLSDRDLSILEAATLDDEHTPIVDAVSTSTCVVTSDTSLEEVAELMATGKFGSVVVVGTSGIEGIFTATDAARVLAEVLRGPATAAE